MSAEENKAIIRRVFADWWTNADLEAVDEMLVDDFVCHGAEGMDSRAGIKQVIVEFHEAFPDLVETVDVVLSEGDMVACRFTARGTHKGVFMDIEPTQKSISFTGIDIYRVVDGKITEMWYAEDLYGLRRQIGDVHGG